MTGMTCVINASYDDQTIACSGNTDKRVRALANQMTLFVAYGRYDGNNDAFNNAAARQCACWLARVVTRDR